jgi:hypothetical protein
VVTVLLALPASANVLEMNVQHERYSGVDFFLMRAPLFLISTLLAPGCLKAGEPSLLDEGYRQMYNLQFQAAHRWFQECEKSHPDEPLGPVSDAAAYLFSEFERLQVLESEFLVGRIVLNRAGS